MIITESIDQSKYPHSIIISFAPNTLTKSFQLSSSNFNACTPSVLVLLSVLFLTLAGVISLLSGSGLILSLVPVPPDAMIEPAMLATEPNVGSISGAGDARETRR